MAKICRGGGGAYNLRSGKQLLAIEVSFRPGVNGGISHGTQEAGGKSFSHSLLR